ncbi:MAG TPA: hypothetical protein PLC53_03945, partial [Bacilli bacterium]|nr:hypothetical protein [Bacilli bacterium]
NILKKLGNINEVIDEYGNSWNEFTITPTHRNTILLQKGTNVFTSKETQSAINLIASLVEEVQDKLADWTLADINKKKAENKSNETLFEIKHNVASRLIKIAKERNNNKLLSDSQINLILRIKDDLLYNNSDTSLWEKSKLYIAQVHKRIINELTEDNAGEESISFTRNWDSDKLDQVSTTNNLMDKVKRLFATLYEVEKKGNDYVEVKDELTGLYKPVNFNMYINYFKNLIPSVTTKEEIIDLIKSKLDYHPSLINLVIKLEENKDNILEAFYVTFKQSVHPKVVQLLNTNKDNKLEIKLNYSNNNSVYRIANEWKESIKSKLNEEWISNNLTKVINSYNAIKNNKKDLNKAIIDTFELLKLLGIHIDTNIIELEVAKDGDKFNSLHKLFLVNLQNIIHLDIKDFKKDVIVEELKTEGRIIDLARIASNYYFDRVENSKLNVTGNNTQDITTPNYMSEWFNGAKSNNPDAKLRFLTYLKTLASSSGMRYSNWLWEDETPGLLIGNKNDINNAKLNEEYLSTFDYNVLDGLKNIAT